MYTAGYVKSIIGVHYNNYIYVACVAQMVSVLISNFAYI